jgi:ubiquitin C-terminal hydrolase
MKNIAHHIRIGRQEDAHEFLLYFLQAMEDSSRNYVMSISKKYTKFKKKLYKHIHNDIVQKPSEDNLIHKIFAGSLASSVTCQKCKTSSKKVDKFTDISLVIKILLIYII